MRARTGRGGLASFALSRPITVIVLVATVIVVGLVALATIPIELIPRGFDSPFLSVWVPWRDAPPREVLDKISTPLEEELSTVKGLRRITSVSITGQARQFMSFKQGTDMDLAYREVRDRVQRARRLFPEDVDRVFIYKDDASGIPVLVLGVAVDPSVTDVYNLIHKQIVVPLERVPGVASVNVQGLEEKEILIEIDRTRADAHGINIYELSQTLGQDSFTLASGHVRDGGRKLLLRSDARYHRLEDLENRPITPSVRLRDIAAVRYDEPEKQYRVRAMSKPAYAIIVMKEGETNAREVCGRLRDVCAEFDENPRLDAAEQIVLFDQGEMIDESLSTLLNSGLIGGAIAACVLFFFLRRFRVTLIANAAVPLSLLVSLSVMLFIGQSLNILSLLGLMVCVGLLVDNAIVVSENIDRMHRRGLSRREAAIRGAGEIGLAITMSTLTTVIVFLPIALVEGPAQFFLLRLSVPISVSLIASLAVALVCIPLGVHATLPARGGHTPPRARSYLRLSSAMARAYDVSFGRLGRAYSRLLDVSLSRRLDVVLAMAVVFGVTIGVATKTIRFVDVQENEDAGFSVDVEMPDNASLEETEAWFLEAEKIVEDHAGELGLEGWFLYHQKTRGELQGWFTTPRTSDLTAKETTARVLELLPHRPGIVFTTGDESQVEADEDVYRVTLHGEDPRVLEDVAEELTDVLAKVEGVLGARRDSDRVPNELGLVIDRELTEAYGVDPTIVAGVVGYALRGQSLPKYRDASREIPVRVRYREEDRESVADLSSFYVPTASGGVLPVSALTDVSMLDSPPAIVRRNKRTSRTVSLDLLDARREETRDRLDAVCARIDLPEGVTFGDPAEVNESREDFASLLFALYVSIVFIYLLMGLLFESFVLPLSIIFTIPLASLGVVWIHVIASRDIDFLGAVGGVLLVGVVVNNGIVLIDFVNRLRVDGLDRRSAILEAARGRFRPIMMTAITTIGGMVPLALWGRMDSGLSYTSFALTLIGGMTTATLLTLLVVPVFYSFFDDVREHTSAIWARVRPRGGRPTPASPTAGPARP